jgi:hypothetical protein
MNAYCEYISTVKRKFCACGCTQLTEDPLTKTALEMLFALPACIPEVMKTCVFQFPLEMSRAFISFKNCYWVRKCMTVLAQLLPFCFIKSIMFKVY